MLPIEADDKGLDNVVLYLETWPDQRLHLTALSRCDLSNFIIDSGGR